MKFIGIIPARFASTRFPGKPLAMLGDKTVIQRVYEQARKELDDVVVATDDARIYAAVQAFGGKAVMTSDKHRSGTDRVREAYVNVGSDADVVINIQGDEPFIHPAQISSLKHCFSDPATQIATLVRPFPTDGEYAALENPNSPKVVVDDKNFALYFSRSVIPYLRGCPTNEWPSKHQYYTHVGIYAYKADVLAQITQLPQSSLELAESLEQLRWLQNGYRIKTATTNIVTVGIDTPQDLDRARRLIAPDVTPLGDLQLPPANLRVLDNGVTLNWYDGGTQAVNQLSLVFPGGRSEAKVPAIADICGLMLAEGSQSKSGVEISEALDFRGAHFMSRADSHFSIVKIASLNSMSQGVLPLFLEMVSKPSFPEYALNIVRNRYIKNLEQTRSQVQTIAALALNPLMMGADNPLAKEETPEEISLITTANLKEFHQRVYTAQGCHAFLSGHITPELLDEVTKMLMQLPTGDAVAISEHPFTAQMPQTAFTEKTGALQDAITIGFPAPRRDDPDYIPLRFAVMALGGYFGSRLMLNVREDKGYTYGIQAYLKGTLDGSVICISTQTDHKHVKPMLTEIESELIRLAQEPMKPDELMRLRQHIGSALMETLDSPFSIINYYQTKLLVGMPDGYFNMQAEIARHLTPELVMEMARKYLQPAQMRVSIAGARI